VISLPAARVEHHYDRGGLWAAIVVLFGWFLFAVTPTVVSCWLRHGAVASGAFIWPVYLALGIVSTSVILRGGGQSLALPLVVCPILLIGVAVAGLKTPGGFYGPYDWPFSVTGWFALVALWRRRLYELLSFFVANSLVSLAVLVALHEADRLNISRFIVSSVGVSILQITIFVGGKAVASTARDAAQAEEALSQIRIERLAADAVQTARGLNYETIRGTVADLLDGLATGELDISARGSHQHVAVAVTRLRRYLVESDEVPDQLSHELDACADAAEREGIAVDLIAPAGVIPPLPVDVRRALTDPIIHVLAATATHARITVVAASAEVVVAIIADAHLQGALQAAHHAVRLTQDAEGEWLWVQASWTAQSPSSS
jgi:hypothetical protein